MSIEPKLIRVLAVDDHPLLREGIATLVNAEPDMKLVAEASNGKEAVEKFRSHRPDITLMDIQMPGVNGIEAITQIQSECPDARIIVLTTYTGSSRLHIKGPRTQGAARNHPQRSCREKTYPSRNSCGTRRACRR